MSFRTVSKLNPYNMVTVSAPGKIHLMGEHAVVYGKPALLAAVNLRLSASVEPAKKLEIISTEPTDYVHYAVEFLVKKYKLQELPKVKITVKSEIPAGYHLGSSAAVAVATVGALMYFLKQVWNPQLVNQLAYEIEKKQHGNPSGGDNTAVTMGGFLWYRRELEFLKSIWQLPFTPHPSLNHFFLINTGKPTESTGEMVAYVHRQLTAHSAQFIQLFDENEEQTRRIAVALKSGDEATLIDAIQKGEGTLEEMGVVSQSVLPCIRKLEKLGGAVKILGGGGKTGSVGFLLCYHQDPKRVQKICDEYHYAIVNVRLGEEGVRIDEK